MNIHSYPIRQIKYIAEGGLQKEVFTNQSPVDQTTAVEIIELLVNSGVDCRIDSNVTIQLRGNDNDILISTSCGRTFTMHR